MSIAREAAPDAERHRRDRDGLDLSRLGNEARSDETRQGAKVTVSVPTEVAAAALSGGNAVWLTWPAEKGFLLPAGGQ